MISQERRDMVAKLGEHRRELLSIVSDHDEAWFSQRSKEGDRSRKGMLKHLSETEHTYIWVWAKLARDDDNPNQRPSANVSPSRGPASLSDEALQMSLTELRQRLTEQRMHTLEFIAETGDDEMERTVDDTAHGTLTVKQCIKSMYRHDRQHIEEMLGLPPTYVFRRSTRRA